MILSEQNTIISSKHTQATSVIFFRIFIVRTQHNSYKVYSSTKMFCQYINFSSFTKFWATAYSKIAIVVLWREITQNRNTSANDKITTNVFSTTYLITHLSLLRLCDWLFLRVGILVGVLLLTGDSLTGDIGPLLPAVRGVVGLLLPFIVGIRLGDCEPLTRENNIDKECSLQKYTGFWVYGDMPVPTHSLSLEQN